jgi:translation initiation factor IF-2
MQGDLKQEQEDMYKKMVAALNTDFIVAFNKVDRIRPDAYKKARTIREYFDAQRRKTSNALGCDEDKIHYLCLDADPELRGRFKQLKKQGVLGFEEFYGKVLENVMKWQLQALKVHTKYHGL